MKVKCYLLVTVASTIYASSASAQANAQSPDAQPADKSYVASDVGEIIVTAQKREQSLAKVGAPVVALSAQTLAERTVVTQADLAKTIPGLSFSYSQYGTPVFTLRGAGFTDTSLSAYPDVTVYVDQIPLPFPVMATQANFDIQRVEVLQGPQGTLFGANATGGAVNYIAAKPTNNFEGGASLTYGRFNQLLADVYVGGPVSASVRTRLAVRSNHADDWQYSYTRDDTAGKVSTLAGRWLVDWDPNDRISFELNVNGSRNKSDQQQAQAYRLVVQVPPTPAVELAYPLAPHNPRAADWDPDFPLFQDSWQYQIALRGAWSLTDDITLTSLSSVIKSKYDTFQNGTTVTNFAQAVQSQEGWFKSYFQELRLDNGGRSATRWVAGLNYSRDDVSELNQSINYEGSALNTGLGYGIYGYYVQNTNNYAVFGNIEHDIAPSITLKSGVRYTQTVRRATSCTYDGHFGEAAGLFNLIENFFTSPGTAPNPPIGLNECFTINPATGLHGLFVGKLDEDNVSYRLGVDWRASDKLLFYFNYSKGYKAGGFPAALAASFQGYAPVKQESLIDYEAGFKAQLLDRQVFVTGSTFYYNYKDRQLHSKIADVLGVFGLIDGVVNVPKSSVKGAEFAVSTKSLGGFTPTLSGSYLDATVDKFSGINDGGQQADYSGTRAPLTPKWSLNADLKYEFPLSSRVMANFGGGITYRSKTNSLVGGTAEYDIPAYTLVDLRAGIMSADGSWSAMVFGKNVFNKYYIINVARDYDYVARYAGSPASYGVTLSYKM